jgi:hypothetical protein
MNYDWDDIVYFIMGITMTVCIVAAIVFTFRNHEEWRARVEHTEASTGCEYIGSPKGARWVGYFDCNGVIETKRIK